MPEVLLIEESGGIGRLTLNRPAARNALNLELRQRLADAFRALRNRVRVVILTGAPPAFCAGYDLAELSTGTTGTDARAAGSDMNRDLIPAIAEFPGPIIAAVGGAAVTAGFELALACDLILASTAAKFADTHVRVGILPGWGLSQRLPRLIGIGRAKELAFTGNFLDASTALDWGLVNRVVAPADLQGQANRLAADMASADYGALTEYKRLIDEGFAQPFGKAMALEAAAALAAAGRLTAGVAAARRGAIEVRGRRQSGRKKD